MPRAALLLVAVAAATALLACKRPGAAPRPHLVQIDVRDRTADADRPARLDLAAVRDEIARLQREAGVFTVALGPAPPPPRAETFRQRVDVEVEEDVRDGQGVARAALRVVIERVDAPPGATRLEAVGGGEKPYPLEAPDPGAVFTGLVKRVVGDVMRGLLQRERLRQADPGAIVAALRSDDPETRLAAVNAAAERRERTAVPALIERLNDADDTIRDRALGALVEIGDRRAVAPLTKQTKFRDLDGMRKVVDAVASLGGDEARSYLEFVATGHEELEIRELAREALDRLTRKESRARAPRQ